MLVSDAQLAMREGRLPDAAVLLRGALEAQPQNPELHYNLALVLARLGRFTEAVPHFTFCSHAAPDNAELLNNLGNAQRLAGCREEALGSFERALRLAPGHPAALCNRGWLHLRSGDTTRAHADFSAALKGDDSLAEAWRGLGECELAGKSWGAAEQALERSLALQGGSADALNSLGVAAVKQGAAERARELFKRALALNPDQVDALTNLGITCEQLGRLDEAERSLQRAVSLRPGFAPAHFHLAHLARHVPQAGERAAIEAALSRNPPTAARIDLEFALGKTLARLGEFRSAFPHFAAARALMAERQPFDLAAETRRMERIAAAHRRVAPAPEPGAEMLFVVGMPRSGTTLTEQILASHSRVQALGESGRVSAGLARIKAATGRPYPEAADCLAADLRAGLRADLLAQPRDARARQLLVDTTPTNFLYLGLLAELLPRCRIVHCRRNPLDTCLSIFEHPLSGAHGYANRLDTLAGCYRAYRDLMAVWEERLPGRIHTLDYESLVAAPEAGIRGLLQFCGLPFEAACLAFHRTERTVRTPSASQVRQPISAASVGRWRVYEAFLAPLVEGLA
jgi:Tfp pilus assembly protein PilF